jgi:hypothetical protein
MSSCTGDCNQGRRCDCADLIHVVPINDLREHTTRIDCWCNPQPSADDESVIVHNSLDQREKYESGELKEH